MTIKCGENIIMGPNKSNFSGVLRVGARIQQINVANTWLTFNSMSMDHY